MSSQLVIRTWHPSTLDAYRLNVPFFRSKVNIDNEKCHRLRKDIQSHCFNAWSMKLESRSNKTNYSRDRKSRNYWCSCCETQVTVVIEKATQCWIIKPPDVAFQSHLDMYSPTQLVTHSLDILIHFPPFQALLEELFTNDQNLYSTNDRQINSQIEHWLSFDASNSLRFSSTSRKAAKSSISKAKKACFDYLRVQQSSVDYFFMARWLKTLVELNVDITVALQADASNRFFRCFMASPIANETFFGTLTMPVFVGDCYHYKVKSYDGVCFNLVTKSPFGEQVPLAWAIIPRENTYHLSWVIQMCWKHGIPVDRHVFFTDQGPLVATFRAFFSQHLISFDLALCTQHLIRSVRHKFDPLFPRTHITGRNKDDSNVSTAATADRALRKYLMGASDSTTSGSFFQNVIELFRSLMDTYAVDDPSEVTSESVGLITQCVALVRYLLEYDPKIWTVLGNTACFCERKFLHQARIVLREFLFLREMYIVYYDADGARHKMDQHTMNAIKSECTTIVLSFNYPKRSLCLAGKKTARMGFKRTNLAETTASTMLSNRSRHKTPHYTNYEFVEMYNQSVNRLVQKLDDDTIQGQVLSSIGRKLSFIQSQDKTVYHVRDGSVELFSDEEGRDGISGIIKKPLGATHRLHFSWNYHDDYHHRDINLSQCSTDVNATRLKFNLKVVCDHHVELTQMRKSICPCFHPLFYICKTQHVRWPFPVSVCLKGAMESLLYHSSFLSVTSHQLLSSSRRSNGSRILALSASIKIQVPTTTDIDNHTSNISLYPPPAYNKNRAHGKGPRIASNGETCGPRSPFRKKRSKREGGVNSPSAVVNKPSSLSFNRKSAQIFGDHQQPSGRLSTVGEEAHGKLASKKRRRLPTSQSRCTLLPVQSPNDIIPGKYVVYHISSRAAKHPYVAGPQSDYFKNIFPFDDPPHVVRPVSENDCPDDLPTNLDLPSDFQMDDKYLFQELPEGSREPTQLTYEYGEISSIFSSKYNAEVYQFLNNYVFQFNTLPDVGSCRDCPQPAIIGESTLSNFIQSEEIDVPNNDEITDYDNDIWALTQSSNNGFIGSSQFSEQNEFSDHRISSSQETIITDLEPTQISDYVKNHESDVVRVGPLNAAQVLKFATSISQKILQDQSLSEDIRNITESDILERFLHIRLGVRVPPVISPTVIDNLIHSVRQPETLSSVIVEEFAELLNHHPFPLSVERPNCFILQPVLIQECFITTRRHVDEKQFSLKRTDGSQFIPKVVFVPLYIKNEENYSWSLLTCTNKSITPMSNSTKWKFNSIDSPDANVGITDMTEVNMTEVTQFVWKSFLMSIFRTQEKEFHCVRPKYMYGCLPSPGPTCVDHQTTDSGISMITTICKGFQVLEESEDISMSNLSLSLAGSILCRRFFTYSTLIHELFPKNGKQHSVNPPKQQSVNTQRKEKAFGTFKRKGNIATVPMSQRLRSDPPHVTGEEIRVLLVVLDIRFKTDDLKVCLLKKLRIALDDRCGDFIKERSFSTKERGKSTLNVDPESMYHSMLRGEATDFIRLNSKTKYFRSNCDSKRYRQPNSNIGELPAVLLCCCGNYCYFGNMTIWPSDDNNCCKICNEFYHGTPGGTCADIGGNCRRCIEINIDVEYIDVDGQINKPLPGVVFDDSDNESAIIGKSIFRNVNIAQASQNTDSDSNSKQSIRDNIDYLSKYAKNNNQSENFCGDAIQAKVELPVESLFISDGAQHEENFEIKRNDVVQATTDSHVKAELHTVSNCESSVGKDMTGRKAKTKNLSAKSPIPKLDRISQEVDNQKVVSIDDNIQHEVGGVDDGTNDKLLKDNTTAVKNVVEDKPGNGNLKDRPVYENSKVEVSWVADQSLKKYRTDVKNLVVDKPGNGNLKESQVHDNSQVQFVGVKAGNDQKLFKEYTTDVKNVVGDKHADDNRKDGPVDDNSQVEFVGVKPGNGKKLFEEYSPPILKFDDFSKRLNGIEFLFSSVDFTEKAVNYGRKKSELGMFIGGKTIRKADTIVISVNDYRTLLGRTYLNDNIVYLWLYLISRDISINTARFHASTKYGMMETKPYSKKGLLHSKVDLFPVVEDKHWSLIIVVSTKDSKYYIIHLNSIMGTHSASEKRIRKELMTEKKLKSAQIKTVMCKEETPQQKDSHDCGVFVCMYASCIKTQLNELPNCKSASEMRHVLKTALGGLSTKSTDTVHEDTTNNKVFETLRTRFRESFRCFLQSIYELNTTNVGQLDNKHKDVKALKSVTQSMKTKGGAVTPKKEANGRKNNSRVKTTVGPNGWVSANKELRRSKRPQKQKIIVDM